MPENMMCSSQKANSREFEENWDRVFGKERKKMGRKRGFKMSDEQKNQISENMKEWAEVKKCPKCGRKNAVEFYVNSFACKYCDYELMR